MTFEGYEVLARVAGWVLLHSLWQGALVAALLGAALRLTGGHGPRWRYALCWAALCGLAAMSLVTAFRLAPRETPLGVAEARLGAVAAVAAPAGDARAPVGRESASKSAPELRLGALVDRAAPALSSLWLLGVVGLSTLHLLAGRRLGALGRVDAAPLPVAVEAAAARVAARLGLRARPRLRQSTRIEVPSLVGWLEPIVLLPACAVSGLPLAHLEALIAHELAHLKRLDHLANVALVALETLFFYHPAVWWVASRARVERELCCDDLAITASGDRLAYARALTSMEELRSPAPALALAANDGSLVGRIRRLLESDDGESAPRRRLPAPLLATGALVAAVGLVVWAPATAAIDPTAALAAGSETTESSARAAPRAPESAGRRRIAIDGSYKAWPRRVSVEIELRHGATLWPFSGWEYQSSFDKRALSQIGNGAELRAEAGVVTLYDLDLARTRGRQTGEFAFIASPAYLEGMFDLGYRQVDAEELLRLALHDVDLAFLAGLGEALASRPTIDDVTRIVAHGIELDYARGVRASGFEVATDGLVRLHTHGVTTAWLAALADSGYERLGIDTVVRFHTHGLAPELLRALVATDRAGLDSSAVVRLHTHGIGPEVLEGLHAAGYTELAVDEIVRLSTHGIGPDYLGEVAASGFGRLDVERLVRLHTHGVAADDLRGIHEAGFGRLGVDALVRLTNHGIGPEFLAGLAAAGYLNLSVDAIVRLHTHGIGPHFVGAFAEAGYRNVDVERLIAFHTHGIDAAYVRGLEEAGLADLATTSVQRLKNHGITPGYVAELRAAGAEIGSIDGLVRLRNHGIDAEFVARAKAEGLGDLSASGLIRHRSSG